MHPILKDLRRLALYLLAWLLIGVLLAIGLRADAAWEATAAFFLPLALINGFIGLSAWYVGRAFPIGRPSTFWNIVIAQTAAAAIASATWLACAHVWATAVDVLVAAGDAHRLYVQHNLMLFVLGALLYWLAAAAHYLLIAFQASRDAEAEAVTLSLMAREAELKALRAQIDPHFMFNSLHSISALTTTDPEMARRMCLLLADFLRDTLRLGSNARISLADEWSLAERFLAIEQVRLGPRLHVTRETDDRAASCLVPPLVLQPLVENAIVHGVAQLVDGGTIHMGAHRNGSTLTLTMENPCDPERPRTRGAGLGLELLRKRLAAEFGAPDAVRAAEGDGRFRVEVRIPLAER